MTELTFLPWSQDGEGPVPADNQPRLLNLHAHVDKRIPGGEDGTNEQRTRAYTSSELPGAPLRWTQRGCYLRAGSWYLLPRLPQCSCLTLELERRKRAGLCHKYGEGRGGEEGGGGSQTWEPASSRGRNRADSFIRITLPFLTRIDHSFRFLTGQKMLLTILNFAASRQPSCSEAQNIDICFSPSTSPALLWRILLTAAASPFWKRCYLKSVVEIFTCGITFVHVKNI